MHSLALDYLDNIFGKEGSKKEITLHLRKLIKTAKSTSNLTKCFMCFHSLNNKQ